MESLASIDSDLTSHFNPRVGEYVRDAWRDITSESKPSGYLDYYDDDDYYYYEPVDTEEEDGDPWSRIYKDGRYSTTRYYDPSQDLLREKSSPAANRTHPLGQILNSIRPLTLLMVLSVPVLLGGLYYLFIVNGPTPVVRARINDLIDELDNENDIPTALYNFLSRYKKELAHILPIGGE